ncbi:hypothetical protein Aab01nite_14910 [Paractinoplanes abujensis]|uniref:Uncharacterized protein n=1 Tax=Paractinoplanes abujensis TaxID=882441 RepID=A0A7W7G1J3_9ACTN|nr:hypothetical protein [Actinoplanes abujensis]MBB4690686.1 hypothetical protein [Actinoplanes abujensis]GID17901.1 hypothetical protein Aab01nite_14910 [Actinoplanes abujensis]
MPYGWMLAAYPKDYRRRHGAELLEPLLTENRRPTVGEMANLAIHGLRTRLGRSASRTVVVWALLVTVIGGMFGAAAGSWVGWHTGGSLPSPSWTRALLTDVAPGAAVGPGEPPPSSPFVFEGRPLRWADTDDLLLGRGGEYQAAVATGWAGLPRGADLEAQAAYAANRLAATGWTVHTPTRTEVDGCGSERCQPWNNFTAARDDLVLTLDVYPAPDAQEATVSVALERVTPAGARVGGALGGLVAAVAAFLVFGWASRRTGRPGHPARLAVMFPFAVGLLLWWGPALAAIRRVASQTEGWPRASGPQLWDWIGQPAFLLLFVAGTSFAALSLLLAAVPPHPELLETAPTPTSDTTG